MSVLRENLPVPHSAPADSGRRLTDVETLVMLTLDTLRFDAAQRAFTDGRLVNLGPLLPPSGWERRHAPATFTYAAHHAFFSGFLPTPVAPGPHGRLFAAAFGGSESTTNETYVFPEATLPEALSARGHRTICVGGTGFFNQRNELGRVLPGLFDEAHWNVSLGVTDPDSPANQIEVAVDRLEAQPGHSFLFINFAAIHQPNWFYDPTAEEGVDTFESHTAALVAIDAALPPLLHAVGQRGSSFWIVCSDHGTAYGEDGHVGHRHAHQVVWDVPYAEFQL